MSSVIQKHPLKVTLPALKSVHLQQSEQLLKQKPVYLFISPTVCSTISFQ